MTEFCTANPKGMEEKDTIVINKVGGDTAEIYMYGVIGAGLDIDANVVVGEMEKMRRGGIRNFRFYVNSEGGEVTQGSALFNYLDRTDISVEWVVDGIAASMMAMLITNPKHKVKAAKYAGFMYHRVQGSAYGNSDEVRNLASMIDTFENSLVEMMAARMKCDPKKVKEEFFTDGLEHWMNAEEAKRRGLVDEIITGKDITPAPEGLKKTRDLRDYYNNQLFNILKHQDMALKNIAKFAALLNIAEKDAENEETLAAAVTNVITRNGELSTQLTAEKAKTAELENRVRAFEASRVKTLIDRAIADKKFGEDEREDYTKLANSDFELAEKMIGRMQGVKPITDRLEGGGEPEEEKDWTFDDYHKKGRLENLKKNNPEKYNKVYKAKFGHAPQN